MVITYVTDVIVHSVLQGVLAGYIMVPILWDTLYNHTITTVLALISGKLLTCVLWR